MTTFTTQDRLDAQRAPLTDAEIKDIWMVRPANTAEAVIAFARAIERAHGIGNLP